jgi:hypothetical protein
MNLCDCSKKRKGDLYDPVWSTYNEPSSHQRLFFLSHSLFLCGYIICKSPSRLLKQKRQATKERITLFFIVYCFYFINWRFSQLVSVHRCYLWLFVIIIITLLLFFSILCDLLSSSFNHYYYYFFYYLFFKKQRHFPSWLFLHMNWYLIFHSNAYNDSINLIYL